VTSVQLVVPLGAGILSFLSPCVWPLVPGYLSFLAGSAMGQPMGASRWRTSQQALLFVAGCALVLIALGAGAAFLGASLKDHQVLIERVGGVVLVLCGLAFSGWIHVPWLSSDHRVEASSPREGWWKSIFVGVGFGLSWSACAGPLLAGVLTLTAVRSQRVSEGVVAMLLFALGQGLPFLAMALLADRMLPVLRRFRRITALVSSIGAVILIALGVLLLSGRFSESV
jgi:cytochrome c-type biogenesis protein